MADEPISALAQRTLPLPSKGSATTSPTQGSYQDEIEILDATDGSMSSATGTNRRIVVGDFLFGFIQAGAGISITEPLTDTNPGIVITNTSTGAVASVFTRTGSVVASSGDYTVAQVTGAAPLASPTFTGAVTLPVGLTGIVKASSGVVSTATAGTDYLTPSGSGASLTGITGGQITGNISGNAASITGSITTSQVSNLSSWAGSTSITTLGTIATGTVPQANVSGLTTALGLLAPLASPTFTGAVTLPAGTVTLAEHANLAASSLMGNPTGSPAAPSAVTLGANLTFSGSTLVASNGLAVGNAVSGGSNHATLVEDGSGNLAALAVGTTGQLLTVASGAPTWSTPAVKNIITASIPGGSNYTVPSSMGNLGTDLSITLPNAGTYLIWANLRYQMQLSAGTAGNLNYMIGQLYDSTNSVVVPGTQISMFVNGVTNTFSVTIQYQGTATPGPVVYTVSGSTVIHVQGFYSANSTVVSTPYLLSLTTGAVGITSVTAMQIY